ncbi:MAG TPA: hypothetical protein VNO21_25725 [Polyangiaceae bacterium]|nr:hypothetical protein [Polyangiaceae bacterium]
MKPRFRSSLTAAVEHLQSELVHAILALVRSRTVATLEDARKSASGTLFGLPSLDEGAAPVRRRRTRRVARRDPRAPAKPSTQLSLFDAPALPSKTSVKDDSPFAITDPEAVLDEVTALASAPSQPAPRKRGRKPRSTTRDVAAAETPAPAAPSIPTAPALREGEAVARTVLGGGIVVRRRRV